MPLAELVSPSDQAARLLTAWVSRNPAGLREELRRSRELDCGLGVRDLESEERVQLLRAVAAGIEQSPAEDPKLRCCLDLLRHLAEMR